MLVRTAVLDAAVHSKTYSSWSLHFQKEVDTGRAKKSIFYVCVYFKYIFLFFNYS